MLEWLMDLLRPIRMTDSLFGDLRYLRDAQFWEGQVDFSPTRTQIEVLIPGERGGPTDQQRAFFEQLQERYSSLWPEVHKALDTEARRVQLDTREFVLVCVDLPAPGVTDPDAEWALAYETRPPSWHLTVWMKAWIPSEILAEC